MHPLAIQLADGWRSHFFSADHDITWQAAEQERVLWLTPNTALVGRVDARGLTGDGAPFFGEWKTMSANKGRRIAEEKIKWRTDPQALTYGVLVPETSRFVVRWAIKSPTPTYDFEWYTYTPAEVDHWRNTLIEIASRIRNDRKSGATPWVTNMGACFQYGTKYPCPMFEHCSQQRFNESMGKPRIPHLGLEAPGGPLDRTTLDPDIVVIGASRIEDYLTCHEKYRVKWEGEGYNESSEALDIGTDFHALIATYIKTLITLQPSTETI